MTFRTKHAVPLVALAACLLVAGLVPARAASGRTLRVGGYQFFKYPSPACAGPALAVGTFAAFYRGQCAYVVFLVDGGGATTTTAIATGTSSPGAPPLDPPAEISVKFTDEAGKVIFTQDAAPPGSNAAFQDSYSFRINPLEWDDPTPGNIRFQLVPKNADRLTGQPSFQFQFNQLGTRTILEKPSFAVGADGRPAQDLVVKGVTWLKYTNAAFIASDPTDPTPNPDLVAADVTVAVRKKNGATVTKTATADPATGLFTVTFGAAEIGDVSAGAADDYQTVLRVRSTGTFDDPVTGLFRTASVDSERDAFAIFESKPDRAQVRSQFVSERGWVEPGEEYVHDIEYRNASSRTASGVAISDTLPAGAVLVSAEPAPDAVSGNTLTWHVGSVAAGTGWPARTSPARRIVVTARAKTTTEDPQILYKDLSDTATVSQSGFPDATSTSHGPKVTTQQSARYGDRPFPVVLVDYLDFKHSPSASGWTFWNRISNEHNPVSLVTHYKNMSFDQLFPEGELASLSAPADADFTSGGPYKWINPYLKGNTCTGATQVPVDPTGAPIVTYAPLGPRVSDGWYQLPGERQYYGQDGKGTAITGALTAIAPLQDLDSGCGPTSKSAYDAASIADPEIDYNEFDSDRNCVVDFFEVAFQGRGGNADSQAHGYDNIWPHSANLTNAFIDANGETGYVSNDQCRDRLERPLWWTDASRSKLTTASKGDALKAYSRVGRYNVNPENGTTSVFAHEYGHSLGLPDFYSTGSRETADYWELMAQDAFQYMSVFSRQDLGWIVPKRVTGRLTTTMLESKIDTHRIDAVDANGKPYTLSGTGVHNGDAYYVEIPHRKFIDKVSSGKHAWFSQAGNGFGCPGHTLDVDLSNTKFASSGTPITLTLSSWYEIEWDYDYAFVLVSTDHGKTFHSVPSANGTTTPKQFNPNGSACLDKFDNGITGTSRSGSGFTANIADRELGEYPEPQFVDDSFDLSECAGKGCVLRFAYSTDPGLAKRGWILDDIAVKDSTGKAYFSDDVEQDRGPSYGIQDWLRFAAGERSPFDHGYYVELRDRVSNDYDSAGQGALHPITWIPGVSIWYTDESHGYGNTGADDPPPQNPLDPRTETEEDAPRLMDASFFPLPGLNTFSDANWTDNYFGDAGETVSWTLKFGCFNLTVNSISGLGVAGEERASVTMAASSSRCAKVLGQRLTRPEPKPEVKGGKGSLPATGDDPVTVMLGAVLTLSAAVLCRRLRTVRAL
jgi:M6 family metalloprotease-like protein/uncharacterized repeat protein (TIGR01451 family)